MRQASTVSPPVTQQVQEMPRCRGVEGKEPGLKLCTTGAWLPGLKAIQNRGPCCRAGLCRYAGAAAMPIHAATPGMLQGPHSRHGPLSRTSSRGAEQLGVRYGVKAKTVPSPYLPPADVVPYSVPFTSIKPARGVAPSEPWPKLCKTFSSVPVRLMEKTVPLPYAPP